MAASVTCTSTTITTTTTTTTASTKYKVHEGRPLSNRKKKILFIPRHRRFCLQNTLLILLSNHTPVFIRSMGLAAANSVKCGLMAIPESSLVLFRFLFFYYTVFVCFVFCCFKFIIKKSQKL